MGSGDGTTTGQRESFRKRLLRLPLLVSSAHCIIDCTASARGKRPALHTTTLSVEPSASLCIRRYLHNVRNAVYPGLTSTQYRNTYRLPHYILNLIVCQSLIDSLVRCAQTAVRLSSRRSSALQGQFSRALPPGFVSRTVLV